MKKADIYISSITGNTRKLALVLQESLCDEGWDVSIYNTPDVKEWNSNQDLNIICFWCRRASMDPASLALLDKCQGARIAAFGTMGSYSDSAYGELVRNNVCERIETRNECAGVFTCRGRIAPERTEKRRKLPTDHPHYLDDEAYERHLSSRCHPDNKDLAEAVCYLKKIIKE